MFVDRSHTDTEMFGGLTIATAAIENLPDNISDARRQPVGDKTVDFGDGIRHVVIAVGDRKQDVVVKRQHAFDPLTS